MNRAEFILVCSVCGEDGFVGVKGFLCAWLTGGVQHRNIQVCKRNLEKQEKRKKEKQISRQISREEAMRDD